jgi:methyltransferase (TIGR00027 family)
MSFPVKNDRVSRTAEVAAAVRARHHLYESPVIFADPFALELTSPVWRRIVVTKPLCWLVFDNLLSALRPVAGEVVARSRYAEDVLEQAIATGVHQYVIVGAGFDSFVLRRRDLGSRLRVFELDHPDTQQAKRERLGRLGRAPDNLEFVAIDFERDSVADALTRSSFERERPAFFSWLGTTPYLSNSATRQTLASIGRFAAAGSGVVFDYLVPDELLLEPDKLTVKKLKRFTARRGEPIVGAFRPEELESMLASIGLELVENLAAAEQEQRYFASRRDGLRPMPASFFAHARVSKSRV